MTSREIYFNVPDWTIVLMYILTVVAVWIYMRFVLQLVKGWNSKNVISKQKISDVLKKLIVHVVVQKTLFTKRSAGIMHLAIFSGFSVLFVITVLTLFEADTPLHFLEGRFYIVFSTIADVFGLILLMGLLLALWCRLLNTSGYLSRKISDLLLLMLLFSIVFSGFLLEGLRIAFGNNWELWSPVGSIFSQMFISMPVLQLSTFHFWVWFGHMLLAFALVFIIPRTKLLHILAAPLNILISDDPGTVKPSPIVLDVGKADHLGLGSVHHLSRKDLVDVYACASCGRCEEFCPAVLTHNQLSPQKVIQLIRKAQSSSAALDFEQLDPWSCTSCGYCTQKCPVSINHQNIIWSLKTYLTTIGQLPASGAKALENLEFLGDPWGTVQQHRSDCRKRLYGNKGSVSESPEFVYWTGCSVGNDQRFYKIADTVTRVLNKAEVDFTVIDNGVGCCGDPARRLGEEGLFVKTAKDNILLLNEYSGSTIITHCPHCYHTLKNEYPKLGLEMNVKHHSEVISNLVQQGKLAVPDGAGKKVVYHDPCYLGRHNHQYEPVRTILSSISLFDCLESVQNRESALCCGGGGSQMWLEAKAGKRIDSLRLDQLIQHEPEIVVTACPYCTIMLENAASFKGLNRLEIKDVGELFD